MAIKIIPEPDVIVTQEEYDQYHQEWLSNSQFTTKPLTLEQYIRNRKYKYYYNKSEPWPTSALWNRD